MTNVNDRRSTCVLVHGGWHGSWHWDGVAERLRAGGLEVFAPTLKGLAERADEATPATDLSAHVTDVVGVIDENDLYDVVLVGHSYGGMVVTGAAHERPDRIAEIVYLDAFVPEDGESVGDVLGPDFVDAAEGLAKQSGTPYMIPPMFTVEQILGWTGERAEEFAARMSYHPIGTMYEPVSAKEKVPARRSFIYCNALPLGLVERYAQAARESEDWRYFELASPHDAMHAMPAAVVRIIQSLAEDARETVGRAA